MLRHVEYCAAAIIVLCALVMGPPDAIARGYRVLYSFGGFEDGEYPQGILLKQGHNLFGTTELGGANNEGSIFKVTDDGIETQLYSFSYDSGGYPYGGLISDKSGNIYSTASNLGPSSFGTIFKLAPDGTFEVLNAFDGGNGAQPYNAPTFGKHGDLYGSTAYGGPNGYGSVYRMAPDGTLRVLYSFPEIGRHGFLLQAGVSLDKDGNIYGAAQEGGANNSGTVFKLDRKGKFTLLHSFTGSANGSNDGAYPFATPIVDAQANVYGTTQIGGSKGCGGGQGCGTVYKISADGTETILYAFTGGQDGKVPLGSLILDSADNLYGTTSGGGNTEGCDGTGCGTVFRLSPDGKLKTLHAFLGAAYGDGSGPKAGIIADGKGHFYGTTGGGGNEGYGTVYELTE